METQYRISEDDYAEMSRLHAWRELIARPSARQLAISAILVILLVTSVSAPPAVAPLVASAAAVFAVLVLALYSFALFVSVPNRARRHYRQYKGIQELITVGLSDDGLRFSTVDGEMVVLWPKILQWRQNARFILIYRMPVMYHVVPKALAREGFDIGLLIKRLAAHVGPER